MVDALPLVDHHCHGVLRRPLDRAGFESFLTEAAAPGRWHGSLFDTQAGTAVRSLCAPCWTSTGTPDPTSTSTGGPNSASTR